MTVFAVKNGNKAFRISFVHDQAHATMVNEAGEKTTVTLDKAAQAQLRRFANTHFPEAFIFDNKAITNHEEAMEAAFSTPRPQVVDLIDGYYDFLVDTGQRKIGE